MCLLKRAMNTSQLTRTTTAAVCGFAVMNCAPSGAQTPQPAAGAQVAATAPGAKVSDGGRTLGAVASPVLVAEYGDLRCPDSARAARQYMPKIGRDYLPRVRYEYRAFPLDSHPDAVAAECAARCAGEQGKYVEFRNHLLSSPGPLTEEMMAAGAQKTGLDAAAFAGCLSKNGHVAAVESERDAGRRLGVKATPTYVVFRRSPDGEEKVLEIVSNPKTYETIRAAIDRGLAGTGTRGTAAAGQP